MTPTPIEILRKVRRVQILTAALVRDVFAGQYHAAFRGRGVEFEEVREYQPGDDVRSIDWNVTARAGRPFIKSFREERELTVLLLVDVSPSVEFGSGRQLKAELVTELGATLAYSALTNNDKVGLILFTDRIERSVPARKGKRHALRVIRELLYHEPVGRKTDVAAALQYVDRVMTRRAVIFLISDFFSPDWTRALRIVAHRHDLIPVCVRDPLETNLRSLPVRYVDFCDAEEGGWTRAVVGSRGFRDRYATDAAARDEQLSQELRRAGIDWIPVRTDQPFIEPLVRFFRKRGAAR